MRRTCLSVVRALLVAVAAQASADPVFVNGLRIRGSLLDATRQPGANQGRFGHFSDLYYDPVREEWWALSDRGPGGGVLDYQTRLQKIGLDVNPWTGHISNFRVLKTVKFTDPFGLLAPPTADVERKSALNGLNPLLLNGSRSQLGRSFDPEGLVIDPWSGHFIVADEYGPSLYEFDRKGRLLFVFQPPSNLVPTRNASPDYVAVRGDCASPNSCKGRQDNRGFEGLAITPDGKKLVAVLQDPLIEEPPSRDGRNGRNVRIVVYDNDRFSPSHGQSIAQYAYQLEPQAQVVQRILDAGGTASLGPPSPGDPDPRQGRNIGLSAILALNHREFLVLERDNRGIGVDNPRGSAPDGAGAIPALGIVGSKRVFRIDIGPATDVTGIANLNLPNTPPDSSPGTLPTGVVPVWKSSEAHPFIDLAANTVLPNGQQAEKWEGLTIGPKLLFGRHVIVAGNDNDYSVSQLGGSLTQYDTYVDFQGRYARCVLDTTDQCILDAADPSDPPGALDEPVPDGFRLLPGVLHAYRASKSDLAGYVPPRGRRGHDDHDCDRDDHDWRGRDRR
jgi:hypothetical protein